MHDDPEHRGFDPEDYRATVRLKRSKMSNGKKTKEKRTHCLWCNKKLPQPIYIGTPQAQGYCSNKCLVEAETMINGKKARKE